jgi:hypothetical protein
LIPSGLIFSKDYLQQTGPRFFTEYE